ncbi:hypothetical protein E2C01_028884 [Portunus trituberculatus]|uniref:BTB domain-containing protein n=1 Tax=Portunus trituberculatus TaxID=210409 RepID=A0A5B7ELV5_PORTR|nr:hypothetical protein [Portunus trituberculatus]
MMQHLASLTALLAFRMGTRVAGGLHFSDKSLVGVSRLLEDLQHLLEDKDSADIIFVIGREETHIAAHKLILKARYFVFQ